MILRAAIVDTLKSQGLEQQESASFVFGKPIRALKKSLAPRVNETPSADRGDALAEGKGFFLGELSREFNFWEIDELTGF